MKVAIFGASGGTGGLLTERCLAAGYEVTALLRSPAASPFGDRVRAIQGSAFDAEAVRQTVEGADVVLSALGARSLKMEDVLERAVPLIVEAMQDAGVRRIVALGGASAVGESLRRQPAVIGWFIRKVLYNWILKWPSASQRAQLKTLSASGLDWTMVLPPMLTNSRAHGHCRIDGEALPRGGSRISRADVADFMMRQIADPQWAGKGVYIAW